MNRTDLFMRPGLFSALKRDLKCSKKKIIYIKNRTRNRYILYGSKSYKLIHI